MNPTTPQEMAQALQALAQSDALRTLETRLAEQNAFNLFDAIGVSNQELRHSDFLAFLLRPHEAHGLGDAFLKWFIHHALAHSPASLVSPDDLARWDLSDANIKREWQNVDLFITSPRNHLAVVVENKIYTGEHDDQLTRYMETVKSHHYAGPSWKVLGVYLTPHGGKPTHPEYLPIGYEAVCAHLEKLCTTNAFANAASPDVETTVRHYTRMLRRKIVGDPEITKLCRELYADHQAAFDRVFIERDAKSMQKSITLFLKSLIEETGKFVPCYSSFYKGVDYMHFVPNSWQNEPALIKTTSPMWRYIYLQIEVYSDGRIEIAGVIAPTPETLKSRLINLITQSTWLGSVISHPNAPQYLNYYRHTLCEAGIPLQGSDELAEAWQEWAENEGPKFTSLIQPGDFPAA